MKEKIILKQFEKLKNKAESTLNLVTHKAFDSNLLIAIRKDFDKLIEHLIEVQKGEIFLFQILKLICEQNKIQIPEYIKNFFQPE
jgi:hypothetical protein